MLIPVTILFSPQAVPSLGVPQRKTGTSSPERVSGACCYKLAQMGRLNAIEIYALTVLGGQKSTVNVLAGLCSLQTPGENPFLASSSFW